MNNLILLADNNEYWERVWDAYESMVIELKIIKDTLVIQEKENNVSEYLVNRYGWLYERTQWYYDLIQKEMERKAG
jgi:hypothetical protein